jgi:NAD(P)-dependent dehydrogenase (short-subunit alcohol dehydrogenase family)
VTDRPGEEPVRSAAELFSVAGKVALVTGATAGLGRRLVEVLSAADAKVAFLGRRQDRLDELAEACPGSVPIRCDLGATDQVARAHATAVETLGPIEMLVNNAAVIYGGKAQEEDIEKARLTLATNLLAPFQLCQLVYPGMKARQSGSIVNISSILAHAGMGRLPQASYAASKGGIRALTQELAAQWGRDGVRVNAIAPGFFHSEITTPMLERWPAGEEFILRNSLISRVGERSDFDGALLYLASEASSFVTGQTIVVDGGWTAR